MPLHECKVSVSFFKAVHKLEHCAIVKSSSAPFPTLNSDLLMFCSSELLPALRERFGSGNVIASDVRNASDEMTAAGPFHQLDVTDADELETLVKDNGVCTIVHLAALLSATGEKNPQLALQVFCLTAPMERFADTSARLAL